MSTVQTSVRLKTEISKGIKLLAEKDEVSVSEVINRACELYLVKKSCERRVRPIIAIIKPKKKTLTTSVTAGMEAGYGDKQ